MQRLRGMLRILRGGRVSEVGAAGLVELLVTMLVLLILMAASQRFLFAGFTTYTFGQDNFEAQQKVELAHKYLDRTLRETREVLAADPKGTYIAVLTDADNDGDDELLEYFVDYGDGKLKAYTDSTYDSSHSYNFANPELDAELTMTEIIADIQGTKPTEDQDAHLSPDNSDSGRPFIFFGDNPRYCLDWDSVASQWSGPIKGVRTFFYVDVRPTSGPEAYSLQTYIQFRNLR
ncbi:MAG: hypothetical protein Kow00129_07300 [Thermoleophilia bacterium]